VVREHERQGREVFIPLTHPPGEAQVDFGFADIIHNGETTRVALFVMTLLYSDAVFCCIFPRECTEAFMDGHRRAFDFFGAVPKRISYDNSKIPVARIIGTRERELTDAFLKLKSHFLFESHFCLVRRPNEKGQVECLVGFTRRNFLVPLPRVDDFETLNVELERKCREDLDRRLRGKATTKAQRLDEERSAMLDLPKQGYEARRIEQRRSDSLSLVRFDRNSYSVPVAYAHRPVTVVAGIDEVRLVADNHPGRQASTILGQGAYRVRSDPLSRAAGTQARCAGLRATARRLEPTRMLRPAATTAGGATGSQGNTGVHQSASTPGENLDS